MWVPSSNKLHKLLRTEIKNKQISPFLTSIWQHRHNALDVLHVHHTYTGTYIYTSNSPNTSNTTTLYNTCTSHTLVCVMPHKCVPQTTLTLSDTPHANHRMRHLHTTHMLPDGEPIPFTSSPSPLLFD